jgi:saccharopine dehydrogenase (NAD+, L-lysine-forming)
MGATTLHLRSETKPLEHRSALTPTTAKALLDAGYTVNIERSPVRIFEDAEFEKIGATLVPEGSWPQAPKDHIIIGLKELPETDTFPLKHTHVQFAHCYKNQGGWEQVLSRFPRGGGTLLDLEFLAENGRRVAAFGYHAGFAGAALAVQAWNYQLQTGKAKDMPGVKPYPTEGDLIKKIKEDLREGEKKLGRTPKALVIGALGRCGRGAVELFEKIGFSSENIIKVSSKRFADTALVASTNEI